MYQRKIQPKMIILRITSGLGNQMFQYAFYTLLKKQYKDTEILCDNYWFYNNHEGRKYELEKIFSGVEGSLFEIKKAPLSKVIKLSGKVPNLFNGGIGKAFNKVRRIPNRLMKNSLLARRMPYILDQYDGELSDEMCDADLNVGCEETPFYKKLMSLSATDDYYIQGFFIEERYYSKIIDEVKKHFVFPEFNEEHNISYAREIMESNSVSIHVRRGDYLSDLYKDKFMTLGREYYERAVSYVKENAKTEGAPSEDLRFFIFSDDAEFVKKEFSWLDNKVIVTENTGDMSFRDMQLMSMCRHNIIANSTFSQWGALLNKNENHLTMYPRVYMKDHDNEIKKMKNWVRI